MYSLAKQELIRVHKWDNITDIPQHNRINTTIDIMINILSSTKTILNAIKSTHNIVMPQWVEPWKHTVVVCVYVCVHVTPFRWNLLITHNEIFSCC